MRALLLIFVFGLFSCSKDSNSQSIDPSKYVLTEDILWASPENHPLTLDIYSPLNSGDSLPVLVIFHGGGWLINDNSIMDQMSQYIASNSKLIVCNVNYRLLSDLDNTVTLDQIVGDALGAVLWVKENIDKYNGDPKRIAVTGDSAGAHLSAMIVNSENLITDDKNFEKTLKFVPSYLPTGMSIQDIKRQNLLGVQASVLSYGAFDISEASEQGLETSKNPFWFFSGSLPRGIFGENYSYEKNPEMYEALSPIKNIPSKREKILPPQFLLVGSEDKLTTPISVSAYAEKLEENDQYSEYWVYEGKNHAFLDSGSNFFLGSSFEQDAPAALDKIIKFLEKVFSED